MSNSQKGFSTLIVLLLVLGIAGVAIGAYYFGRISTSNSNQFEQQKNNQLNQTLEPAQDNSKIKKSASKIAYVKDGELVVINVESEEFVKSGIPIKWQDPTGIYCQGFNWSSD